MSLLLLLLSSRPKRALVTQALNKVILSLLLLLLVCGLWPCFSNATNRLLGSA
jgi:hypothetical protein